MLCWLRTENRTYGGLGQMCHEKLYVQEKSGYARKLCYVDYPN